MVILLVWTYHLSVVVKRATATGMAMLMDWVRVQDKATGLVAVSRWCLTIAYSRWILLAVIPELIHLWCRAVLPVTVNLHIHWCIQNRQQCWVARACWIFWRVKGIARNQAITPVPSIRICRIIWPAAVCDKHDAFIIQQSRYDLITAFLLCVSRTSDWQGAFILRII